MYWQTPNSSNTVRHQRVIFFRAFGKLIQDKNLEVLTANRKRILIRALLLYTCTHQPPKNGGWAIYRDFAKLRGHYDTKL